MIDLLMLYTCTSISKDELFFIKMFRYACEESRYATNDLIAHGRQRTE